ncbi:hypothetical protein ACO1L5_13905, partial [Staphylococcus aureus]
GLLIVRWHRDGLRLPDAVSVGDCLRAFRGGDAPPVGATVQKYVDAWAFRVPGLMLAYAKGEIPSTSVPSATWQRLIYGNHDPAP